MRCIIAAVVRCNRDAVLCNRDVTLCNRDAERCNRDAARHVATRMKTSKIYFSARFKKRILVQKRERWQRGALALLPSVQSSAQDQWPSIDGNVILPRTIPTPERENNPAIHPYL